MIRCRKKEVGSLPDEKLSFGNNKKVFLPGGKKTPLKLGGEWEKKNRLVPRKSPLQKRPGAKRGKSQERRERKKTKYKKRKNFLPARRGELERQKGEALIGGVPPNRGRTWRR